MPKKVFTPTFMATGLVCPAGVKKIEYSVADDPGLFVECRASEKAVPTWYLRLKNERGTNIYKKLGTVKDLSLTQAKKLAKTLRAEHALAPKQTEIATVVSCEMTLDQFMTDHYFPHARVHKRSVKRDEQLWRIRIKPKFGDVAIASIGRRDVQVFHAALLKEGLSPASCDHHVKLLRHALNLAVDWEMLEKNPLRGIKLFNVENELNDFANDEELARLLDVLRTDENRPVCRILLYLLSTGARRGEALKAKWEHIDLERRVWVIPAADSKSKRIRSVPLNDSAVFVLKDAGTQGVSEWAFPNPQTKLPYCTITRVWYRLRKKAGIKQMRIHSYRHGFASLLVSNGRSLYEVQQLLGHADPRTSMRYAKIAPKALQEAANAASVVIQAAPQKAA